MCVYALCVGVYDVCVGIGLCVYVCRCVCVGVGLYIEYMRCVGVCMTCV